MTSIYELAKSGKVKELENELQKGKDPNDYNDASKKTALGVAVFRGDIPTTQLLLKQGADPNGLERGRPPLWIACNHRNDKANSYERLIQILLSQNADPRIPSKVSSDKSSTPLIQAVKTYKSPRVISALVDNGADPTMKVNGMSAEDLAQGRPQILNAMRPYWTRFRDRTTEVAKVTSFVMAVVFWANKNLMAAATAGAVTSATLVCKDAIFKRFRVTGKVEERYRKYFNEANTFDDDKQEERDDLKTKLGDIVKENNLGNFFPSGSPFIDTVVEKAVDLNRDPDNLVDVKDLAHLAFYQPVLYCDDSSSMNQEDRSKHLDGLSQRIASITTRVVPDDEGIELRFINEDTTKAMSKPTMEEISQIIQRNRFHGWTEIGLNLKKKVLEDNVYKPLRENNLKRPVLVSIVTDGHPQGDHNSLERRSTLKETIKECGSMLKEHGYRRDGELLQYYFHPLLTRTVVRFQLSQIGNDPKAEDFLNELRNDSDLDGVLYITSERLDEQFKVYRKHEDQLEQWLLKLLLAPLLYAQAD
ncbi:hypothetical protein BO83DRAFT_376512 [Aspergillus eucalypticola CBS 122712]|uniref:Uncharacterized protein n=1 Tax=Aspergillus eucalypticola (strain CBS 122712 / IBT 29274) TaxID=1448314 RepID=A0A317VX89_ASPEC|nr:uncharacterized protein BO83DRAFT_376512 [Aspergillus eucalypticola CBS 122712]PWY79026.1 hypothetical protein BO83DRAFT_376512 [Aspergillus eucalypticola CBS 122712]